MRLSIIVPVYNGGATLGRCLVALGNSSRQADEIIVVDDGSTDDSRSVAAFHGARVLQTAGGPLGPARARNLGATAATGDVLVFIDADVLVHDDTLARIESTLAEQPDVRALFGSYDDAPPAPGVASRFKNLLHHYVHQHGNPDASTFWAGCGAIRKSAFLAVAGFSESYRRPSIEDVELGVRLRRAGLAIRLCPAIQATHLKRWTLASVWSTDIFARAVPWTRLIIREGALSADLNLDWRSRLSAACTGLSAALFIPTLCATLLSRTGLALGLGCAAVSLLALVVAMNARLYTFFLRRGGLRFAVAAGVLHLVYLLYSSAIFAVLVAAHKVRASLRIPSNPS